MTLLDYFKQGIIKELFTKGVVNINYMTYFRYYQVYEAYKAKGLSKRQAILFTSDECGCSESTIKRAIRVINQ